MVVGFKIRVEGLDKLDKTLISKSKAINTLDKGVKKTVMRMVADAKRLAPVDTSALRKSIHYSKMGKLNYKIADGVNYGIYQEVGTRHTHGKFFMRQAVKMNKHLFADDVRRAYQ